MVSTRGVKFKFSEGEKVLCYEPDPTKAKVLYESKVLELVVSRDNRGRKVPEYLVHFFGWNSSWDRCVSEDFVLPDNEENRTLQKRLAGEAAEKLCVELKGKKRRKLPPILKEGLANKLCSELERDVKRDNSDKSDNDTTSRSGSSEEEEEEEEVDDDNMPRIEIPDVLKKKLEDDCYWITRKGQLVRLPSEPNVVSILEAYVKHMATNLICGAIPVKSGRGKSQSQARANEIQTRICVCQEVMDGLRILFEFTLSDLLLYNNERSQYTYVSRRYTPLHNPRTEGDSFEKHLEGSLKREFPPSPNNWGGSLMHSPTMSRAGPPLSCASTRDPPGLRQQHSPTTHQSRNSVGGCPVAQSFGRGRPCGRQLLTRRTRGDLDEPKSSPIGRRPSRSTGLSESSPKLSEEFCQQWSDGPSSPTHSPAGTSTLGSRVVPPPPLSISSISSRNSCGSSPHSGPSTPTRINAGSQQHFNMSGMLSHILAWQMIPSHIYEQKPAPPSLIYGAQHLLRLFVKLPEIIQKMTLPQRKRNTLLRNIDGFLVYLVSRQEELFPASAYADHQDVLNSEYADH